MLGRLFFHIISATLGLFLASTFIDGVKVTGPAKILIFAGVILGIANFFIKPILKIITLPLQIITFGLFTLVINMLLVWVVADIFFPKEIEIKGLLPLFLTTVIIFILNFFFGLNRLSKKK